MISNIYDYIPISECNILETIDTIDLYNLDFHPFISKEEFLNIDSEIDYVGKAKTYAIDELEKIGFDKKFGESFVRAYYNMIDLRHDIDLLEGLIASGFTKTESIQTLYIKRNSSKSDK
jgi:hypothetical protein